MVRARTETLYDHLSPAYWNNFGNYDNSIHLQFIRMLLQRLPPSSYLLDAACGAGRYEGVLSEAGNRVLGVDQSAGMLARAREHFPETQFPGIKFEQTSLQELDFQSIFDGVVCIDALEHIFPEDWPLIISHLALALRPGGLLYASIEDADQDEVDEAYNQAKAQGLPVVYGEVADKIDSAYQQVLKLDWRIVPGELADQATYHFHPSREQLDQWISQAGLIIEEKGSGKWYSHFLFRKQAVD
jgi:2-polyprenyl-3-methyl-5-hydroxy-6-metoxy-1,4-benzoquinol methylase